MTSAFDPFRMGRYLGFDPVFEQLDRFLETATSKITFPPYNLAKLSEQMFQLQFALAGFSKDEIRVRQEGDYLVVEGSMKDRNTGPQMLHQGISAKDFMVKFLLAEGVMVDKVEFDNGLLSIQVQKPVSGKKEITFKIQTPLPRATPTEVAITRNFAEERTSDMMDELRDHQANN